MNTVLNSIHSTSDAAVAAAADDDDDDSRSTSSNKRKKKKRRNKPHVFGWKIICKDKNNKFLKPMNNGLFCLLQANT